MLLLDCQACHGVFAIPFVEFQWMLWYKIRLTSLMWNFKANTEGFTCQLLFMMQELCHERDWFIAR